MLPLELFYIILGYITDDKLLLRKCSLVNHCWRNIAQQFLFKDVEVNGPIYKLSNFLENIRDHLEIPSYIHRLSITCTPNACGLSPASFGIILDQLPRLKHLRLDSVLWRSSTNLSFEDWEPAAKSPSRTLETLELKRITMEKSASLHGIWDILLCFNSIRNLHLDVIPKDFVIRQPPRGTTLGCVNIERLVVERSIRADVMLAWLIHQPIVQPIQSLFFAASDPCDYNTLASYLVDAGSSLQDLTLNMTSKPGDQASSDIANSGLPLKSCSVLSSLCLKTLMSGDTQTPTVISPKCWQSQSLSPISTFLCFGHLLRSAPTTIRHLHLVIHSFIADNWFEQFQNADWDATIDVINRITSLEDLHFHIIVGSRREKGGIAGNPKHIISRAVSFVKDRFAASPHKRVLRVSGDVLDDIVQFILSIVDTSSAYTNTKASPCTNLASLFPSEVLSQIR